MERSTGPRRELETLPPGSNRIIETGLWHARAKD